MSSFSCFLVERSGRVDVESNETEWPPIGRNSVGSMPWCIEPMRRADERKDVAMPNMVLGAWAANTRRAERVTFSGGREVRFVRDATACIRCTHPWAPGLSSRAGCRSSEREVDVEVSWGVIVDVAARCLEGRRAASCVSLRGGRGHGRVSPFGSVAFRAALRLRVLLISLRA